MRLTDSVRRGLRTLIDVLLSAATSGLVLVVVNLFKHPSMTAEQYTGLCLVLTPVLSTIKNNLEDRTGVSLLVSKVRPMPDPTQDSASVVKPTESEHTDPAPSPEPAPAPDPVVVPVPVPVPVVVPAPTRTTVRKPVAKRTPAKPAVRSAPVKATPVKAGPAKVAPKVPVKAVSKPAASKPVVKAAAKPAPRKKSQ